MLLRLWTNELRKLSWNRSYWAALAGALLLSALVLGLGVREVLLGERFPIARAGQQLSVLMGLVFVALSGAWVAQEYQWRTLALLFSRGIPRLAWLAARLLALIVPGLLLIVLPYLVAWGYSQAYAGQIVGIYLQEVGSHSLKVFVSQLPYLMLAVALGIWSRSVALASAGPLLTVLLIEPVAATLRPALRDYLPALVGLQYVQGIGQAEEQLTLLSLYLVVFLLLATIRLQRQDLGG